VIDFLLAIGAVLVLVAIGWAAVEIERRLL
jgi:hypothetical protein